jgi:hypothetical protein
LPLPITVADGSLGRIDTVILRLDLNARTITAQIITGTPAVSPSAPALVRTSEQYDLMLAKISVLAGTTAITSALITDTRLDSSVCGITTTTQLQDGSVTASKIAEGSVKTEKLDSGLLNIINGKTTTSDVFNRMNLGFKLLQSYTTAGTYTWTAPDVYGDGRSYKIGVYMIGGGGSGANVVCEYAGSARYGVASGGASGGAKNGIFTVTPGSTYSVVIGSGGSAGSGTITNVNATIPGSAGGTTSFNGLTASGGEGGNASFSTDTSCVAKGASGGQGSDAITGYSMPSTTAPGRGMTARLSVSNATYSMNAVAAPGTSESASALNPFDLKKRLGAGGSATCACPSNSSTSVAAQTALVLDDGLQAGNGRGFQSTTGTEAVAGYSATSPGSGGGAIAIAVAYNVTANIPFTVGKGADGAVFIYVEGLAS